MCVHVSTIGFVHSLYVYCFMYFLSYYHIFLPSPVSKIPEQSLDLMDKLLTLDPCKRISATDALDHPYLKSVDKTKITPPE